MSVYMQPAKPWTLPKGMTGGTRDYVQTTVSPKLCVEEKKKMGEGKRYHTAALFSLSLSLFTFIIKKQKKGRKRRRRRRKISNYVKIGHGNAFAGVPPPSYFLFRIGLSYFALMTLLLLGDGNTKGEEEETGKHKSRAAFYIFCLVSSFIHVSLFFSFFFFFSCERKS